MKKLVTDEYFSAVRSYIFERGNNLDSAKKLQPFLTKTIFRNDTLVGQIYKFSF